MHTKDKQKDKLRIKKEKEQKKDIFTPFFTYKQQRLFAKASIAYVDPSLSKDDPNVEA